MKDSSIANGGRALSVRLPAGQELRLEDATGWTVVCGAGAVWITQEADARDIFLSAGEGFALDRGGLALVCGCRDAVVSIRPPAVEGAAIVGRLAAGDAAPYRPQSRGGGFSWLRAVYPECGPWNDPASYRRSGLI